MKFAAIRSEGFLITSEVLGKMVSGQSPGQSYQDFGFRDQTAFEQGVTNAWLTMVSCWQDFVSGLQSSGISLPENGSPLERWLRCILDSLGFGKDHELFAGLVRGQIHPVSCLSVAGDRIMPLHMVPPQQPLDSPSQGFGRQACPHRVLQGYLNRTEYLWGIVTNGLQLRILRKSPRITQDSYLEFDLKDIIESDLFLEFEVLYRVAHRTRWPTITAESIPCWLENFREMTLHEHAVSSRRVTGSICDSIEAFWHGFRRHHDFESILKGTHVHPLECDGVLYRQVLSIIYRLIFLMICEERDLSKSGTGGTVFSNHYYECYSISRLHEHAEQPIDPSDINCDLWEGVKQTFKLFSDSGLGTLISIQPWYSDLFHPDDLSVLDHCKLYNRDFLKAFRCLSRVEDESISTRIDYSPLNILGLGSFYEFGLAADPMFPHRDPWLPGGRDTPPALVNEVLKHSLEPVITKRLCDANTPTEKEDTLLGIRICDPAAKSGRFLVAAARRLGKEIARIRTGTDQPPERQYRSAIREVTRDCIYGLDVDPLAVEFCRFALWIDSCDPGKPIVPLHHRIKVGNGLIGADSFGRLHQGIPNAAFDPVKGDDKKAASRIKTRNRRALKQINRSKTLSALLDSLDETINSKREPDAGKAFRRLAVAMDTWTASFFCPLSDENDSIVPTNDKLAACLDQEKEPDQALITAARKLSDLHKFFHWPLDFPNMSPPNEFDVVLGNPPWNVIDLSEEEFRRRHVEILGGSIRPEIDKDIHGIDPIIKRLLDLAEHFQGCFRKFVKQSGRYALSGAGVPNTYALFVELVGQLLKPQGRACLIVPTGIAVDHSTHRLFLHLVHKKALASIIGFTNELPIFQDLDHSRTFCLLSIAGDECPVKQPDFAFFCRDLEQAHDQERHFTLSVEDLALLSPNTYTAPMFRTHSDAELTKKIYRQTVVLRNESAGDKPWGVYFISSFHMSNDKSLFRINGGNKLLPLYEGKMIDHFDHRYATFSGTRSEKQSNLSPARSNPVQKAKPDFGVLPRYWVSKDQVRARCNNWKKQWILGIRSKRKNDAERTVVACILPRAGIANSIHGLGFDASISTRLIACLLANLNSLVLDYVARQKVGGADLGIFVLEQLPIRAPEDYSDENVDYIVPRVVELTYTSTVLQAFARECSYQGKPFRWDEQRRAVLQAELDAFFARLYGLERNDLRYILDPKELHSPEYPGETFRVLKEREIKLFGEFKTQRLVLEAWDSLDTKGSRR